MPRAFMNLPALRTLVVLLGLLAHLACAIPAHAQPAIRELRSPKGLLQLDSSLFLFADDGTAGTLDELYWPYPKRRLAAPEKPTPA